MTEEKYLFKPETKKLIAIVGGVGLLLVVLGLWIASSGGGHVEEHALLDDNSTLLTSIDHSSTLVSEAAAEGEHHAESPIWKRRLLASLWQNNVMFTGLAIIGLFFVTIQYAASAGWSAPIKRIPLSMASWLPIAGVLMIVVWFIGSHDIFHWTHALYGEDGDEILKGKQAFFFWPLDGTSGLPLFYILRMVIFFAVWYLFFIWIKREMLAEDVDGLTDHWYKLRKYSALFLIFFGVSSSVSAWDWVMSIDPHWFSTMFGWYVFASWWVMGLAFITFTVAKLKNKGYLPMVNSNHLHDLGKFVFAFSIFWTYIWFSQFLLIYYANIPEETVYFVQRLTTSPYSWVFYLNIVLNFVLPFLLFMTRDSKRQITIITLVCPIVLVGHWFDFYLMINPGIMKEDGGIGLLEIGMTLVYGAAFVYVMLSSLSKMPLVAKNHPMLQESVHHHI